MTNLYLAQEINERPSFVVVRDDRRFAEHLASYHLASAPSPHHSSTRRRVWSDRSARAGNDELWQLSRHGCRDVGCACCRRTKRHNRGGAGRIADEQGAVWREFGVTTQPAFSFINDDGTTETRLGAMGVDGLTERINELIAS